ncbi:MAG: peroxiredoxin [Alphaproteobacteria bacterium]|nr:peroxiredoxin [Alphaproteobacteria bacterium]
MTRFVTALAISTALALPAIAALKPGASAPDFSAKASLAGKPVDFSLKDALKKGPVVVYFYPAAFTQGCNIEAHTFAENKEKFEAANTTIIGVSRDGVERLNEFSADPAYCAGKFPVASDPDGSIAKSFDLNTVDTSKFKGPIKDSKGREVTTQLTERTTYVITPDSKVVATLSSADDNVTPVEHVDKSLAIVQGLMAKK